MTLPDTQNLPDARAIAIPAVGVTPLAMPLTIQDGTAAHHVAATVALYTSLAGDRKGTHLSRLVEGAMPLSHAPVTPGSLRDVVSNARSRLDAEEAFVAVQFRYDLQKPAPVSELLGYVPYDVCLYALDGSSGLEEGVALTIPVTTLCPCSKAISDYGAHNQRGRLAVTLSFETPVADLGLESMVSALESLGSSPVYSILKRTDEKEVTERAFETPKFVEDVLRDAVVWLEAREALTWYRVRISNDESIHAHNAVALYDAARAARPRPRPRFFDYLDLVNP